MPFRSLTDAEYEDIFKAAIGDCYEVESSYIGDICKSLAYRQNSKRKTVEDEVVTPNENEALTPGETAKHGSPIPRTENIPQKPKKVKLFSAHQVAGEKKIIPVFKSTKSKPKIKDRTENGGIQKAPQDNPKQEEQNTKNENKTGKVVSVDHCKTASTNKETSHMAKEQDKPEQEHKNAKNGKKIIRGDSVDHCKTTSTNIDSDETCFATPTEKPSSTKLNKKSSEMTVSALKGKKNVNKIHSDPSGSSPIKCGEKNSEMNSTAQKDKRFFNKDKVHSETINSAAMKKTSQTKKTTNKSNLSDTGKEIEPLIEADVLSDNCLSSKQTTTPAPSGERQYKLTASSNSKIDSESSQLVPSQQEIPLSQPPAQYNLKQRLKWLQVRREVGVWVQCCNESCSKWRYLESTRDPQHVPRKWFCNMNPDKSLASCAAPQKGPSLVQELDLIENQYTAGSVVWARLAGYPWWPAMVDDDPDVEQYYWITTMSDIPTHYNVVFFDEKPPTRAWITPNNLRPFTGNENRKEYKMTVHRGIDYSKRLEVAKAQAMEALQMDFRHRLQNFSFLARFKGPFVMNTRGALSNKYLSQSQEEFEDNDDMIQLLKEVKHRRQHSLAKSNMWSQKKISENRVCKGVGKSKSEANVNTPQKKKQKEKKMMEKELVLTKHFKDNSKQTSETNTHARLCNEEITGTEDTHYSKTQDKTEEQNNEALPCLKDISHEKEQDQLQSSDNDDNVTVMSEDMFGEDDATQLESAHEIIANNSSSVVQNEQSQDSQVIKPEDNQDSVSSDKILQNLVPVVCTNDDQESKSSVNIQKKDEPEKVTGDSTHIPSSLQVIVGTGGAEEMTSSTKIEKKYQDQQSSSLPSTSHSPIQSECKVEHSNVVKEGSPSQSSNNNTHALSFTDETQEQLPSHVNSNTGACSVVNAGEGSDLIEPIPEVPAMEYPDDAVVPQGFSPSSRESSPDFEAEE